MTENAERVAKLHKDVEDAHAEARELAGLLGDRREIAETAELLEVAEMWLDKAERSVT